MDISTISKRMRANHLIIFFSSLTIALTFFSTVASGLTSEENAKLSNAKNWLVSQQKIDGGFELSGFPGFETPDAILAIATSSQSNGVYSFDTAFNAVSSVTNNGSSPLDYVDDLVDSAINVATACKLIVNVSAPLGLDPQDFDPSDDSATEINLVDVVQKAVLSDGSYGAGVFNATLTCAMAEYFIAGSISEATLSYIEKSQAADGSFNYAGEPTLLDGGADTSALALEVLVAGGRDRNSKSVENVLKYFAKSINADGSFSNFGTPDPNSTAIAIRGFKASGISYQSSAWRDFYAPGRSGNIYTSPEIWLLDQQEADDHFLSPYDSFGTYTFTTSQTISALSDTWFPVLSLEQFVPPTGSIGTPDVEVAGITVASNVPSTNTAASVLLADTGSDSQDMLIVAFIVIVLGAGLTYGSKKLKKT